MDGLSQSFRPTPYDVYAGSDPVQTKALYTRLEACGPIGCLALNLFRAERCASQAASYEAGYHRKGSIARSVNERKAWSLENLCRVLMMHWRDLRISWGWRRDPREKWNPWVMYVDLPQGQVAFGYVRRLAGPDYYSDWDCKHLNEERILAFCAEVLEKHDKNLNLF